MTHAGLGTIALLEPVHHLGHRPVHLLQQALYAETLVRFRQRTGAAGLGDLAMTAMFIGLVSACIGSYLGGFISSNGRFTCSGTGRRCWSRRWSAGVMALFVYLAEKSASHGLKISQSRAVCSLGHAGSITVETDHRGGCRMEQKQRKTPSGRSITSRRMWRRVLKTSDRRAAAWRAVCDWRPARRVS